MGNNDEMRRTEELSQTSGMCHTGTVKETERHRCPVRKSREARGEGEVRVASQKRGNERERRKGEIAKGRADGAVRLIVCVPWCVRWGMHESGWGC